MKTILVHAPGEDELVLEREVEDSYREQITRARNIVIKAGSDVLVGQEGELNLDVMANLIKQMAEYVKKGYRITFVTSGSVAAGKAGREGDDAKDIDERVLSAEGQPRLMGNYDQLCRNYLGRNAAQAILEESHFQEKRKAHTKNFFDAVYKDGGLVIVNANDPMWTGELKELGKGSDNDQMAFWMYGLLKADLAIYLSTVDGFIHNMGEKDERKIDLVVGITRKTRAMVKEINSTHGSYGMESKLKRIDQIMDKKGQAIIANGKLPDVVSRILSGEEVGTYFARKKEVGKYLT